MQTLEDERINDLRSYTKDGITHIRVLDMGKEFELINDQWVEKEPF